MLQTSELNLPANEIQDKVRKVAQECLMTALELMLLSRPLTKFLKN